MPQYDWAVQNVYKEIMEVLDPHMGRPGYPFATIYKGLELVHSELWERQDAKRGTLQWEEEEGAEAQMPAAPSEDDTAPELVDEEP